jgi:DNA repair exonuclease SbcCD nuclease subunit
LNNFVIVSDVHLHEWSAFSYLTESGLNSRLKVISDELMRAADFARDKRAGLIVAGDLIHSRGEVTTQVINVMVEVFSLMKDLSVFVIPGNHDLAAKIPSRYDSVVDCLKGVGVDVVDPDSHHISRNGFVLMPWYNKVSDLRSDLVKLGEEYKGYDCVIHAPVNGVIRGIPDNGLDPSDLARFGFKRIFSGHYHNHVDFGNGVYSVGATTHQTWNDVGTKSGFLYVTEDSVEHIDTKAPKFVDFDPNDPEAIVGNYVRMSADILTPNDKEQYRQWLIEQGAVDALINRNAKPSITRTQTTKAASSTINQSIANWIEQRDYKQPKRLYNRCSKILEQADAI